MTDSNQDKKDNVVDEHPLNSNNDEKNVKDKDNTMTTTTANEEKEPEATIDIDLTTEDDVISKPMEDLVVQDLSVKDELSESTEAWKENNTTTSNNHPLESVADNVEVDPWAQQKQERKIEQEQQQQQEEEEHEDISLLDNEENHSSHITPTLPVRPITNSTGTKNITTAAAVAQVENTDMHEVLDNDTTHVKGFYNTEDSNEIVDLQVIGKLPDWLICEHFTVGPGTYDIKYMRKMEIDGELQHVSQYFTFGHWFDSLPLVNRFDIHGQRNSISYRNRLTCQRLISKIRDNHGYSPRHPAGLFKTKTNQTILTKFIGGSGGGGGNKARADAEPCGARILSNIPGFEGRLFCQNFANHVQELDPFDMKPTRLIAWNEINPAFKGYSSCANGHHDLTTGEYINFTMDVGYQSTRYNFFSISDRNPKGSIIGYINAPASYVNSFSITRSYIILVLCPHQASGMKYVWSESILDSFTFNRSQPTLFYVLSRESGKHVTTFRSEACFAFHHINAFEDDNDNIYLDMICYTDDTIAHQLTTENLRNPNNMQPSRLAASEVRRYVLNTVSYYSNPKNRQQAAAAAANTNTTTRNSGFFSAFKRSSSNTTSSSYSSLPETGYEKLLPPSIELPQVNPNYKMHHYNYLYGLGFSATSSIGDGKIWDSIIKMNVNARTITGAWYEKDCYPSEAVFIPRPSNGPEDEVAEDDGVLLSIVMDSARATSFLLVLDAASLSVMAKTYLGTLVPLSFGRGSYRLLLP
ncbi:retinal pigment epithelial membrane protein-domain-containing protein [Circinella umbellata]|nr:retinal pigment epithelial membrane protein-domain-containing protein [Circinella umbellata]